MFKGLMPNRKAEKLANLEAEQIQKKLDEAVKKTVELWVELKLSHYESMDVVHALAGGLNISSAKIMKGGFNAQLDLQKQLTKVKDENIELQDKNNKLELEKLQKEEDVKE